MARIFKAYDQFLKVWYPKEYEKRRVAAMTSIARGEYMAEKGLKKAKRILTGK